MPVLANPITYTYMYIIDMQLYVSVCDLHFNMSWDYALHKFGLLCSSDASCREIVFLLTVSNCGCACNTIHNYI